MSEQSEDEGSKGNTDGTDPSRGSRDVAAPATVGGERASGKATGPQGTGRRMQAKTREPGDLPRNAGESRW